MTPDAEPAALVAEGFFVLRTPLLPWDELAAWSEGLGAPAAVGDPERLAAAIAADRDLLRARLRVAIDRPEVREALYVASPDLVSAVRHWLRRPEDKRGQRVERALVRYFSRMAGRATPFGLFAGCSLGRIGPAARLRLEARGDYRRHSRLDNDFLVALTDRLAQRPELRRTLPVRPNSSLYRAAGRLRFAEARQGEEGRTYHLVAVEADDYLDATLERARGGAPPRRLAEALVDSDPDGEITLDEAWGYVDELIAGQVLVSELSPPVTGDEPTGGLVERLADLPAAAPAAAGLDAAQRALEALDEGGLGADPARYRAIAGGLEALGVETEPGHRFQVDLIKPAAASLPPAVVDELVRGAELLHRTSPATVDDGLEGFRKAFVERYEDGRLVPLVEALDEEIGIGTGEGPDLRTEAAPLLAGIPFAGGGETPQVRWTRREHFLLRRVQAALAAGEAEIALGAEDFEKLEVAGPPPLPDAFFVHASLEAASAAALESGEFRVLIQGAGGPSGLTLVGRFCHADPELTGCVRAAVAAEEALEPGAVFAEVVHLPEGRLGNVLARPVLRGHEIPYLGRSGAPAERQIPVTDLLLTVSGGRVELVSERLGRRVIPRLTSAHHYPASSLGVYRFLCTLQGQRVAGAFGWDWGALRDAPFLPRVTAGRLVLSRARWHLDAREIETLGRAGQEAQTEGEGPVYQDPHAARFAAVQELRVRRKLPRWVSLAEFDNQLPVDLDNALAVDTFVELLKGRGRAILLELFPGPEALCAEGPEGRFVHEIVVPLRRDRPPSAERPAPRPARGPLVRTFPPGSEWLYAKLYSGTATCDELLREVVAPAACEALAAGAADRWFFIRYGDPHWHLRVRLHGDPERLHREVLPALSERLAARLAAGGLWRFQLDTYEREVERYGGPVGIEWAERIFWADSECVADLVAAVEGDAGAEARWRLALLGIDALLSDFGLDLPAKAELLRKMRPGAGPGPEVGAELRRALGTRFRGLRGELEGLLGGAEANGGSPHGEALAAGREAFARRSRRQAPWIAELVGAWERRRLACAPEELLPSLLHMHVNRLTRAAGNEHETVLYEFLHRLYEGAEARARAGVEPPRRRREAAG